MTELEIKLAWRQPLAEGIAQLGLAVSVEQQERLLRYVALLAKWNQAFNLTSVRDPLEMIPRHLLDSLAVGTYLHGSLVLDVGTGAGLPGIPLAILYPHRQFMLLDSNGKKIRFVRQAIMELGLDNVTAEQARVEAFQPYERFDVITTRAFAELPEILAMTRRLLAPGGCLLALKGRYPQEELAKLAQEAIAIEVAAVQVPGLQAERHLVLMTPQMPDAAAVETDKGNAS